jgi:hypothetical protein
LRRRARAGLIPSSVDDEGRYHFAESTVAARSPRRVAPRARPRSAPTSSATPERDRRTKKKLLGSKKKAGKKRPVASKAPPRKKRGVASSTRAPVAIPRPPARSTDSGVSRKKKLAGRKRGKLAKKSKKVVAGKKKRAARPPPPPPPPRSKQAGKKKKRRAKKSKRPHRPPPSRPVAPLPPGWIRGIHGVPIRAPGFVEAEKITADAPMPRDMADKAMGEVMRDYIMARFKWEREGTHLDFVAHKHSFRQTYGIAAWHETFDWIVDEWDLASYIFDREALRDS